MISFDNVNLTEGYIARHTLTGSRAPGREAAIIDIAQDLLLSYLEDIGKMDEICIKGGTAIRKLYAGKEGRFSLDLDFRPSALLYCFPEQLRSGHPEAHGCKES